MSSLSHISNQKSLIYSVVSLPKTISRKWQGESKIFQKRRIFFRTYNQQSHWKEYLKKGKKTHQSVGKYNPNFQKGASKTKNRENFSNLSFLTFSFVLGREKFLLIFYPYKLLFLTHLQKERELFSFFKIPP